ncbi:hypothetical protein FSP39_024265 [Pinctada imbricata]|uniref:Uncharacterized protein n=1 Tax=Pinctada imbricata TaxID=66713 RepID=A0AA88Y6M0_PINIB|nr:hypothetical protein FSP39_024265 [Pinctada imbricata]
MATDREFITVGYYVDKHNQRMRLDSYGIPKEDKFAYTETGEPYEYACAQIGSPLYVFIYHYNIGKELNIFPIPDPPYKHCSVQNISNTFPPSPILENLMFVERTHDNVTVYDHWRSEYFLFTMDYFFHVSNGLPYKLFVNSDEHQFLSIETGDLNSKIFLPPEGVDCYYA